MALKGILGSSNKTLLYQKQTLYIIIDILKII